MKNFHNWNSKLRPGDEITCEFAHLAEMVWDACALECAKLCREKVKEQKDTEPSRIYTFADQRWEKVLEDLISDINDH